MSAAPLPSPSPSQPPQVSSESGCGAGPACSDSPAMLLRSAGLRVTRPRLRILEILEAADEPIDIDAVVERSRPFKLEFSTVFRTFQHLEKAGVIRRLHLGRATTFFEKARVGRHHDHITCNLCGRVSPIPGECPVEVYEKILMEKTGFVQVSHSLEFFGVCPSCAKSATAEQ